LTQQLLQRNFETPAMVFVCRFFVLSTTVAFSFGCAVLSLFLRDANQEMVHFKPLHREWIFLSASLKSMSQALGIKVRDWWHWNWPEVDGNETELMALKLSWWHWSWPEAKMWWWIVSNLRRGIFTYMKIHIMEATCFYKIAHFYRFKESLLFY